MPQIQRTLNTNISSMTQMKYNTRPNINEVLAQYKVKYSPIVWSRMHGPEYLRIQCTRRVRVEREEERESKREGE